MIENFRRFGENSIELTDLERKIFSYWPIKKKPNSLVDFSIWLKNCLESDEESDTFTSEEKTNIKKNEVDIWLRFCMFIDRD